MKQVYLVVLLSAVLFMPVWAQDTVHLKGGWNILGSVKAGPVPEILLTVPDSLIASSYWGYTPGVGYSSTDTLESGVGYWVKAKSDGIIVFNNHLPIDSCKSKAFIYEGKLYHTVLIGGQCWMAENLDVGVMVSSTQSQTDNDTIEKYCYDNEPSNCITYGGLYLWSEAMQYTSIQGNRGICPMGWHLPSFEECQAMSTALGGDGNSMKALGQGAGDAAGTNTSGFTAFLAGGWFTNTGGGFLSGIGFQAFFWSSTGVTPVNAQSLSVGNNTSLILFNEWDKDYGFSVRCLLD